MIEDSNKKGDKLKIASMDNYKRNEMDYKGNCLILRIQSDNWFKRPKTKQTLLICEFWKGLQPMTRRIIILCLKKTASPTKKSLKSLCNLILWGRQAPLSNYSTRTKVITTFSRPKTPSFRTSTSRSCRPSTKTRPFLSSKWTKAKSLAIQRRRSSGSQRRPRRRRRFRSCSMN